MEHIIPINILFVILGLLLNMLIEWINIQKKNKQKFSIKKWFKVNKLTVYVTAIISFLSLYFVDFGLDGLGVSAEPDALFYQAHSFMSGFTPYATLAKVLKIQIDEPGKDSTEVPAAEI